MDNTALILQQQAQILDRLSTIELQLVRLAGGGPWMCSVIWRIILAWPGVINLKNCSPPWRNPVRC